MSEQKNNPLHGKRLDSMLEEMVQHLGWENMGYLVPINCFKKEPSIKSSLKFLRRTPWARTKAEEVYLDRVFPFINKE